MFNVPSSASLGRDRVENVKPSGVTCRTGCGEHAAGDGEDQYDSHHPSISRQRRSSGGPARLR